MGMSSSQARMLTLTARMHDIEYKAQRLEAQKLQMANDSRRVYEDYLIALDKTKLQYKAMNPDGSVTYHDATLAALENGLINYDGETSSKAFFLKDVKTNAIYISKDYADKIGITEDSEIYTGTLEQYLIENNADTKEIITGISTVNNSNYENYTPAYYTYTPVVNGSEILEALDSGRTYSVSSGEELAKLAQLMNAQDKYDINIVLEDDIDMSSVGFTSIEKFTGMFDGNGKTISELTTSLFDKIEGTSSKKAEVKNLKISGSTEKSGADNCGLLANSASYVKISNIEASGSVTGVVESVPDDRGTYQKYGNNVGGLVGYISDSEIEKCSYSGSVSGNRVVGGFVGYANNTTINNCSSKTKTGEKITGYCSVGGFIGRGKSVNVSNCSSDCDIKIIPESAIIEIDSTTGAESYKQSNPDSGGFVGTDYNGTYNSCEANGSLTALDESRGSVIAGFLGCTNSGSNTIISNSTTYVDLEADKIYAAGFAGLHNGAKLTIKNCDSINSISSNNSASCGFVHDSEEGNQLSVTDCYTSNTTLNFGTGGSAASCTNGTINNNTISVAAPSFSTTSPISADAIDMNSFITGTYTIPNMDSYKSNILAVFNKLGMYDDQTASSSDKSNLLAKIDYFLSKFADTPTDNQRLYYLNNKICAYLNGELSTEVGNRFANNLWSDVQSRTTTNTAGYQSGETLSSTSRASTGSSWSPDYKELKKGTLTIPNINTIKANMKVAFEKAGIEIDSEINTFFAKYDPDNNQDKSYLARINEIINNYASGTGNISELANAVISNTKIQENYSKFGDNAENFIITMKRTDESSSVSKTTETVFDMSTEKNKNLVAKYNLLQQGFIIVGDDNDAGMDKSTEWLTNMVNSGTAIIVEYDYKNNEPSGAETSVSTNTALQEVSDEIALKKAEAKYEADMKRIDMKDRKYDTELAALDNERNAIKQEMETLKTVAKDNTDRTFKLFS